MLQKIESHIGKLREKPDHVKKRIAFLTSFSITAVIFVFWIASFNIQSSSAVEDTTETEGPISSISSSLSASVGGFFNYIKDMIFTSNEAEYSSDDMIEVIPGKR